MVSPTPEVRKATLLGAFRSMNLSKPEARKLRAILGEMPAPTFSVFDLYEALNTYTSEKD